MAERAAPGGFLAAMAAASRQRAEALRGREEELRARLADLPRAPRLEHDARFDLVAEFKRRAPSAGVLAGDGDDPARRAAAYAQGGAAAISVLTEPARFSGSLDDLAAVARSATVPAMRKDFLVDPVQLSEARLAGAAGALVVVAIVDDGILAALDERARELEMFLLLEAFDECDLGRIEALLEARGRRDRLVGVNARD
ncbi:MAG: indole-3-glycerol-phosphate synthase TrpC, partial [Acidobacteria bacterium]